LRRLEGKTAWVTGSGRGIGRAIALALAGDGANVVVSSRTLSELQTVVTEIESLGARALALQSDAMSLEETLECVDQISRVQVKGTDFFWIRQD